MQARSGGAISAVASGPLRHSNPILPARRRHVGFAPILLQNYERATLIQNGGLPSAANLPGKPQRIAIVNPPLQYPIAWSRSLFCRRCFLTVPTVFVVDISMI